MELDELEWGDVLAQSEGIVWCQARLGDDQVVAVRWSHGLLESERAARLLLADAVAPTAELIGSGEGWMVLEDLRESMWRPITPQEQDDAQVLSMLGRWLARAHRIEGPAVSRALPASALAQLLAPELVELALPALPGDLAAILPSALESWANRVGQEPVRLGLGHLELSTVYVMGALDAMPTDLSLCCASTREADLLSIRDGLEEDAWRRVEQGYLAEIGEDEEPQEDVLAAERGRALTARVVGTLLAGQPVSEADLAQLRTALTGGG